MNVLVADDIKSIRTIVIRTLKQLGVGEVDEAGDGTEALRWLSKKNYHLVIVDQYMPHHLGIEVVLDARARGCQGPIIMQTTEAQRSCVMRAVQAGVTDYVLKPFNTQYLLDRLEPHVFKAEMVAAAELSGIALK